MRLSLGSSLNVCGSIGKFKQLQLPNGGLAVIDEKDISPVDIFAVGQTFIDKPYHWGGRSAYSHAGSAIVLTGVDCSGLINLLYRLKGPELPRDAHGQYLFCRRCEPQELKPGDLAFHSDLAKSERISHVLLYLGEELFLEASPRDKKVELSTAREKWGVPLISLRSGKRLGMSTFYFGKPLE